MRRIIIGADHGGVNLKDQIVTMLKSSNEYDVTDIGTHVNTSVDYPDIAQEVGKQVAGNQEDLTGILVCGSGIGVSIAANKIKGIRAALCHDAYTARMARQHNNANVLCLGERVTGSEVAKDAVMVFLKSGFEGGRHANRVDLITKLESK